MTDYLDRQIDYDSAEGISVFDETPLWSARFGALLLDHLAIDAPVYALDLACGAGFPLFELAASFGAASRFVGLDLWDAALGRAAVKRRVYAMPEVGLVKADGALLPFANAAFDLIVSNVGPNNFADLPAVFAECARVTRIGGRIALTTNPRGTFSGFYGVLREVLAERAQVEALVRLEAHEAHRLPAEALAERLDPAGYGQVVIQQDSFAMPFVDGSAFLRHPLIVAGFLPTWRAIIGEEHERDVLAEVERRLNARARIRGGFTASVPMRYVEAVRV